MDRKYQKPYVSRNTVSLKILFTIVWVDISGSFCGFQLPSLDKHTCIFIVPKESPQLKGDLHDFYETVFLHKIVSYTSYIFVIFMGYIWNKYHGLQSVLFSLMITETI